MWTSRLAEWTGRKSTRRLRSFRLLYHRSELAVVVLLLAANPSAHATVLVLTSDPVGAQVILNGEPKGVTPLQVIIPDTYVGAAALEFKTDSHVPARVEVNLVPGQQVTLKVVLVPVERATRVAEPPAPRDDSALLALSRQSTEAQRSFLVEALRRFESDCGTWPAALADLTASDASQLSRLYNSSGGRIVPDKYRGPYIPAIPVDPATGQADWVYDDASGEVRSRAETPPDTRLEPLALPAAEPLPLEQWLDLFCRASGLTELRISGAVHGPAPLTDTGPAAASDSVRADGDLSGWQPLR